MKRALIEILCVLFLFVLIMILITGTIEKNFIIVLGFASFIAILYMAYIWLIEKSIKKHNFDMENPLIDNVTITEFHSLNNDTKFKELHLHGWVCKDCGDILWLDKKDIEKLPEIKLYHCTNDLNKVSKSTDNK